ncbi:MAG: hypothetical protein ACYC61_13020 [Isosphaeraceae bacterium]
MDTSVIRLMTYQRFREEALRGWPEFRARREERLLQWERNGKAAEKITENILEDLFTLVLGWPLGSLNHQVGYADLILTDLGVKHLVVEAKRPGLLQWNRRAVDDALAQALRYGGEQRVRCIAVSDGMLLYAADIANGGLRDRLFVHLTEETLPEALWWLSRHGIYRPAPEDVAISFNPLCPVDREEPLGPEGTDGLLLHPRYRIPCRCFAYVGHPSKTSTWKLPYLKADGAVDEKRLPKAIQCILTNYRGAKVGGIPEAAIPDVLVRLGIAAARLGRMPGQCGEAADVYRSLAAALEQFERQEEIQVRTEEQVVPSVDGRG